MKKVKLSAAAAILILILTLAVAAIAGFTRPQSAYAASGRYDYHFVNYNVVYDIESDRYIHVTETMEVSYDGWDNTGFARYLVSNSGEIYKNVGVKEEISGQIFDVYYEVKNGDDGDSLWVDIGDRDTTKSYSSTQRYYTYILTYDMGLMTAPEGKNMLSLNAIGVGRDFAIDNFSITVFMPEGFEKIEGTIGNVNSDTPLQFTPTQVGGRTAYVATGSLAAKEGVSFDATFKDGALTTYVYFTPYWFVIACAGLLLAAVLIKIVLSSRTRLVPVVCFEPPDDMDPLMMGKLIDNKVNPEDISAMIFYWADKGYVKIDFENKDDPVLLREVASLPANRPDYEQLMFTRLFGTNYEVHTAKFDPVFSGSVTLIKKQVDAHASGLNDTRTMSVSILIAIFSGLLAALAPLLLGVTQINPKFIYITSILMIVPALIVYALSESVWYNRYKLKKYLQALCYTGILALAGGFTALYIFLMPDFIMPKLAKGLMCLTCFLTVMFSVSLVSHTKKHTENLRNILGFKKFITTVEKPQLEKMIEENPELYYHILPYAQVLGVSDKWEDKFKNIAIEPPRWASSPVGTILEFHYINSIIRLSSQKISSHMITRTASSNSFGGFGGFGGHVGGGHGGGGFGGGR